MKEYVSVVLSHLTCDNLLAAIGHSYSEHEKCDFHSHGMGKRDVNLKNN